MPLPAAPDDFYPGQSNDAAAEDFAAVTPSDSVVLPFRARALYIGVAGDVTVFAKDGTTAVLFKACTAGTIYPIRCSYVKATGTTATNIVALR